MDIVIEQEKTQEELLVLAEDNIFTFSLKDYIRYFQEKNRDCI